MNFYLLASPAPPTLPPSLPPVPVCPDTDLEEPEGAVELDVPLKEGNPEGADELAPREGGNVPL